MGAVTIHNSFKTRIPLALVNQTCLTATLRSNPKYTVYIGGFAAISIQCMTRNSSDVGWVVIKNSGHASYKCLA